MVQLSYTLEHFITKFSNGYSRFSGQPHLAEEIIRVCLVAF